MASVAMSSESEINQNIIAGKVLAQVDPGEEIVISGLAGCYPDSYNVNHFRENLFNKMDLISGDDRRWSLVHPEIPKRGGRIFDLEKFDATPFGIHHQQVVAMDPMCRILLEKTFEALLDAGIHPSEIKGTRTGVFLGLCFSESEKTWIYEKIHGSGCGVTGCMRSMLANRLSYYLGIDGPSHITDTACSSSLYAMEQGYRALRMGQCDMAIVAGSNICIHPFVTVQFARLGVLNKDGNCKCFDNNADGYTRAEAIVVVILQKSKDARRIYCHLIHAKTNCDGYKEYGITYPSGALQTELLNDFYKECNVNPLDVPYIEAHGTGTKVGDPEELSAIQTVFCPKERKDVFMIGSVKSNIGHTEPVSGLCSVTKVILNMESGYLIPNINFKTPKEGISALTDGRMKVVTDTMKWKVGYSGVSSFGFGGGNCHVLLKANPKEKHNYGLPNDDIPRLVYLSGRNKETINNILDEVASKPMDAEFIGLLHEIFKYEIDTFNYRGYGLFTKNGLITRELDFYSSEQKSLWFVLNGLGNQWHEMASDLMNIPIFAGTIEKCHQILSSKGISIVDLITKTESPSAKQTNIFVTITSIQIALVELFKYIDIKATGVIGYSIGEIACAYFDGSLTLEQALLCSYYLGQASDKCKKGSGSMIYIENGHKQVQELLTPGLEIVGKLSEKSFIVSGPNTKIQEFIKKLKQNCIIFEEINTTLAYHSSYVKEIATSVLKHLKSVVPKAKKRSDKWISTLENKNNSTLCSAEFLSSILVTHLNVENNYKKLPQNAIILEFSHGQFKKYLKQSVLDNRINISLMEENNSILQTLMIAIGKLYKEGFNPRIERIYPKVSFPVSRTTPMLSSLIKWNHSQDWFVTKVEIQDKIKSGEKSIQIIVNNDEFEHITGHVIDGRVLFPATGYIALVWQSVGVLVGHVYTETPVVFEDVKYHRATHIAKDSRITFIIMIHRVSGIFEITEGGSTIVTGRVFIPNNVKSETLILSKPIPEEKDYYVPLNSRDIYKELRLRGYNYTGLYRGFKCCDTTATIGQIAWKKNWIAFMDNILQMQILQVDTRGLFVPTAIQKLIIDIEKHDEITNSLAEDETIPAYVYKNIKTIICGGVEIRGLQASVIGRKKNLGVPVLETYKFIPNNIEKTNLSLAQSVRILLHIIMENCLTGKMKTTEVLEDDVIDDSNILSPIIIDALGDIPLVQPEAYLITSNPLQVNGATISDKKLIAETNCVIVIVTNILKNPKTLQVALNAVMDGGFIICREDLNLNLSEVNLSKVNIVADHKVNSERLILLSKRSDSNIKRYINITDPKNNFNWLPTLQECLKTEQNICIYSQGDEFSGIIGFMNCLMREPTTSKVKCVFIMDQDAPTFDPNNPFYSNQLDRQARMNILKDGQWGTYRHLLMDEIKEIEVEHAYVNVTVRGDLSSLRWLQGGLSSNTLKLENTTLVHVYYSAVNFRDIMTATGRIAAEVVANGRFEQDCVQGLEYAGRLDDGRRVTGMVAHLATATLVAADPELMWSVPDNWSLEEAVTVPIVYGTVLFSVIEQGKIKPGMSILIHSGTGGVGQAAINIALYYKCTVYTTVGSVQKREFIKKHWPQIKDNQIGNSRDLSFEQMIMRETNGRGVDIILNSLAEEKLLASTRCLAKGGRFLEIGKFDLAKDNQLPITLVENGQSFHGIMLDMFLTAVNKFKELLNHLIVTHFENGAIKPLQRTVFNDNEIETMFRYMASGKHMGKVLLKIRDEEPQTITKPPSRLVKAVPRYYATKIYSYIIIGGLGGFGLELADWLIIRGVRKIVLNTRRGVTTGYQAFRIKTWESYGVEIVISKADITTSEGCRTIIEQAAELGPVEGIFNLGVVLKDAIFPNQTIENFKISFGAKATATKYLDELSRELCPHLKQFVVFSSVSCGRGNAGQSNYGMSNSVMERICEKRRNEGYPALAVEWGAVGDVGLVAELQEDRTDIAIGGTLQQRISNCLSVLDQFLQQKEPLCASMLVAEKRAGYGSASNILDAALNILGISDIKTISVNSTLAEQGMDSIMAVEIKQTLESDFEVFLTPQDIRSLTFARLQELAAERESITETSNLSKNNKKTVTFNDLDMQHIERAIGDEENSNKPFIILPSNAAASCTEKVLLIPGIEGMGSVLKNLASHLTVQSICLQLGFTGNSHNTTIPDMAESLLDRALLHLPDLQTNGFTIIGYSFGVFIALELAALLEARGAVGRLVLIDGSPTMLKEMTRELITENVEEEIQNNVLASIINMTVSGEIAKQIQSIYVNYHTWDSKVDAILEYVEPSGNYSLNHFRNVCDSIYLRLKAVINYESNIGKLKSNILLIRPTQHSIITDIEDFGLSEFTNKPVSVQYVVGDHASVINNPECSNVINELFAKDVILDKESVITKIDSVKHELLSI